MNLGGKYIHRCLNRELRFIIRILGWVVSERFPVIYPSNHL